MLGAKRSARWVSATSLLVGMLWTSPANADLFVATWNHHLHEVPEPTVTPFWDCRDFGGGGLICAWLWQSGLEISSDTDLPLYGDGGPSYDAYGTELPFESDLPDSGLLRIVAACRVGQAPCFKTFTPIRISVDAYAEDTDVGAFMTSSRGGLVTTSNGTASFTGTAWTDITSMAIGMYLPDECGDPDIEDECGQGEQRLYVNGLTFEAQPVPEPGTVWLLGAALLLRSARGPLARIGKMAR
jgi:hypothetical protein